MQSQLETRQPIPEPGRQVTPENLPAQSGLAVGACVRLPSVDDPWLDLQFLGRKILNAEAVEEPRRVRRHERWLVGPVIEVVITEEADVGDEYAGVHVEAVANVPVIAAPCFGDIFVGIGKIPLAADVQAVVAANYVRNLREETIKGFYGRLKQGVLPMPSPLGYLDAGPGKPKTVDPVRGPLIQEAFRLYSSGRFSQRSLCREMARLGLRTKRNGLVSKNTLAGILSNTFYFGLICIRKGNQSFIGAHAPLISRSLFDQVQDVLAGRTPRTPGARREFQFSRLVRCKSCARSLIAELQKQHVYYRCHTRECPPTSFREEVIDRTLSRMIRKLKLHPDELPTLDHYVQEKRAEAHRNQESIAATLDFKLTAAKERMNRLTDIYIDSQIDSDTFNQRKKTLLSERLEIENQLRELSRDPASTLARMEEIVELVKTVYLQYESGNPAEKRQMVQIAMSNRSASGKTLDFALKSELSEVAKRPAGQSGGPRSRTCRMFWKRWLDDLCQNPQT